MGAPGHLVRRGPSRSSAALRPKDRAGCCQGGGGRRRLGSGREAGSDLGWLSDASSGAS